MSQEYELTAYSQYDMISITKGTISRQNYEQLTIRFCKLFQNEICILTTTSLVLMSSFSHKILHEIPISSRAQPDDMFQVQKRFIVWVETSDCIHYFDHDIQTIKSVSLKQLDIDVMGTLLEMDGNCYMVSNSQVGTSATLTVNLINFAKLTSQVRHFSYKNLKMDNLFSHQGKIVATGHLADHHWFVHIDPISGNIVEKHLYPLKGVDLYGSEMIGNLTFTSTGCFVYLKPVHKLYFYNMMENNSTVEHCPLDKGAYASHYIATIPKLPNSFAQLAGGIITVSNRLNHTAFSLNCRDIQFKKQVNTLNHASKYQLFGLVQFYCILDDLNVFALTSDGDFGFFQTSHMFKISSFRSIYEMRSQDVFFRFR